MTANDPGMEGFEAPPRQVDPLDECLKVLSDVRLRWDDPHGDGPPSAEAQIAHAHALAATCHAIFARQLVSLQAAQLQQAGLLPATASGLVLPG